MERKTSFCLADTSFISSSNAQYIGNTSGAGSFHIPNWLYEDLVAFLREKGIAADRGYGNGPSRKLRLIKEALGMLGFSDGIYHGIERSVYLFPLAKNLKDVIRHGATPRWHKRTVSELTQFWKKRWALPRVARDPRYLDFDAESFLNEAIKDLDELV